MILASYYSKNADFKELFDKLEIRVKAAHIKSIRINIMLFIR